LPVFLNFPGVATPAEVDAPVSDQTDYGIFWAEDPDLSPNMGGEDFWTVSLRLVPKPAGP
jgi:hypothetical protein